ncbi:rod shape-determining protein MreC [Lysobacter sp. GX 14042]|uniref:rod shape-determining protein MreC n=1 Tax=Lysobacter sp. GX 14042 TaxID=2907155 RepID=UPI0031B9E082
MPALGTHSPNRQGEVVATLKLLGYLALAALLIVLDHRGGWLAGMRGQASLVVQPLWSVAGWPGRAARRVYDDAGTLAQLTADNERLRNELLVSSARITRLQTLADDNARLRALLGVAQSGGLDVQLAPILDIDLDPARQRLVLDAGSNQGVRTGQSVLDAGGLVGQVIEARPLHATALLLTDPAHAVPVMVARSQVRLVAYGQGRSDLLRVPGIPLSSDVEIGDELLTSGLGGRFPPGFPVGTLVALQPDESGAFLVGEVRPAAQLDRGRAVLLLREVPSPPPEDAGLLPGEAPAAPGAAADTGDAPEPEPEP